MSFGNIKIILALVLGSLVLISCGQRKGVAVIPTCPAVGLVSHTGSLTRFVGKGHTTNDVAFDATLTGLDSKCVEGTSEVETTISFSIIARKGPALQNPVQDVRYFVTVLRDDYQVTSKKIFTTQVHFAPGKDKTGVRETIVQRFEDRELPRRYRYEVLIGFDMSPDELKFTIVR